MTKRRVLLVVTIVYLVLVTGCFGLIYRYHSINWKYRHLHMANLSYLFNKSTVIQDDLYLENDEGLGDELAYILRAAKFDHNLKNACGELKLTRPGDKTFYIQRCSVGGSYASVLVSHSLELTYPVTLGDKVYGSLTLRSDYINDKFSLTYVVIYLLLLLLTVAYSIFVCMAFNGFMITKKKVMCDASQYKTKYHQLVAKISNTHAIINNPTSGNKRHFPINDSVAYIEYKNAYSEIYYTNGKTLLLRVSLSELEHSIYGYFIRIKRNILVNKHQIANCGKIEMDGLYRMNLRVRLKGSVRVFPVTNEAGKNELSTYIFH